MGRCAIARDAKRGLGEPQGAVVERVGGHGVRLSAGSPAENGVANFTAMSALPI